MAKKEYFTMTVSINEQEISCLSISKKEYEKQLSKFEDVVLANKADDEREIEYTMFDDICNFDEQHYSFRKTRLTTGLTDIVLRHYWCHEGYSFKK